MFFCKLFVAAVLSPVQLDIFVQSLQGKIASNFSYASSANISELFRQIVNLYNELWIALALRAAFMRDLKGVYYILPLLMRL